MRKHLSVVVYGIVLTAVALLGLVGGLTLTAPNAYAIAHCACLLGDPCDCQLGCFNNACFLDTSHAMCGLKPGCDPC